MYNHLSAVTPDYNYTLDIKAGSKALRDRAQAGYQTMRRFDDGTDETVSFLNVPQYYVSVDSTVLTVANAAVVFDLFSDPAKANRMARSFKLAHKDGHTYVVKFASDIERQWQADQGQLHPMGDILFRVIGRIND